MAQSLVLKSIDVCGQVPKPGSDCFPCFEGYVRLVPGRTNVAYAKRPGPKGRLGRRRPTVSPSQCISCETKVVTGNPDLSHNSKSNVERPSLTMRLQAADKRILEEDRKSYGRKSHSTLVNLPPPSYGQRDPAMEAGLSDRVRSVKELVSRFDRSRMPISGNT